MIVFFCCQFYLTIILNKFVELKCDNKDPDKNIEGVDGKGLSVLPLCNGLLWTQRENST